MGLQVEYATHGSAILTRGVADARSSYPTIRRARDVKCDAPKEYVMRGSGKGGRGGVPDARSQHPTFSFFG